MTELFKRVVRVTVGPRGEPGRQFASVKDGSPGFRINVKVDLDDTPSPDSLTLQLWNLNADSRGFIRRNGNAVIVEAGYGTPEMLFSGDIDEDTIKETRDGGDLVLELEAGDGRQAFRAGRLNETFDGPTQSSDVIRRLADAMGLRFANLPADLPRVEFSQGYTVAGSIQKELTNLTRTVGARWSIQNGELVVTRIGATTGEQAVLLSANTGLIGIPEKKERGVSFVSLYNPLIRPRRKVKLESRDLDGFFVVKKMTVNLDSGYSDEFYSEVENAVEIKS